MYLLTVIKLRNLVLELFQGNRQWYQFKNNELHFCHRLGESVILDQIKMIIDSMTLTPFRGINTTFPSLALLFSFSCRLSCQTEYVTEQCGCRMIHMPNLNMQTIDSGNILNLLNNFYSIFRSSLKIHWKIRDISIPQYALQANINAQWKNLNIWSLWIIRKVMKINGPVPLFFFIIQKAVCLQNSMWCFEIFVLSVISWFSFDKCHGLRLLKI